MVCVILLSFVGQLVPRPLDIMNIRKRTELHLYPQVCCVCVRVCVCQCVCVRLCVSVCV